MGNIDLKSPIQYHLKTGELVEFLFEDIKGKDKFPPLPP
jgi:hypothetical protein